MSRGFLAVVHHRVHFLFGEEGVTVAAAEKHRLVDFSPVCGAIARKQEVAGHLLVDGGVV